MLALMLALLPPVSKFVMQLIWGLQEEWGSGLKSGHVNPSPGALLDSRVMQEACRMPWLEEAKAESTDKIPGLFAKSQDVLCSICRPPLRSSLSTRKKATRKGILYRKADKAAQFSRPCSRSTSKLRRQASQGCILKQTCDESVIVTVLPRRFVKHPNANSYPSRSVQQRP